MTRTIVRTVIIVLLASLALPVMAATEIIPCVPGNKWEYDSYKIIHGTLAIDGHAVATMQDESSGSSVYEVLSQESGSSPVIYNYREVTDLKSISGSTQHESSNLKISNTPQGLLIHSSDNESSDESQAEKESYDPPLLYFSKSASSGKSWDVGMMRSGDIKSPVSAKVAGKETVTVPAGTFKDCLKVVYTTEEITGTIEMMGQKFNITSGRRRGIYWVADGIGVVKELEVVTSGAQAPGPSGKPVMMDTSFCTVSELRPGYVVKK
ncbi:MAG: hypothetical protein ABFD54_09415 [Armatimonadota bacterium]|nr:hypothetical protein [bacterium]